MYKALLKYLFLIIIKSKPLLNYQNADLGILKIKKLYKYLIGRLYVKSLSVQVHLPADVLTNGMGTGWGSCRKNPRFPRVPCDATGLLQTPWN